MRINRLSDMQIKKIALVKSPANLRRFLLLKSQESISKPGWDDKPEYAEIRYRLKDPDLFKTCRRKALPKHDKKPRIFALYCQRTKNSTQWEMQSLRFLKEDDWTLAKAKQWVKDHPDIIKTNVLKEEKDMDKADKPLKTQDGMHFPAEAYAYVADPQKTSTWKIRLWETPEKKETVKQVEQATAQLSPGGVRNRKADIPAKDLAKVKAAVRAAWKKVNPDKDEKGMPASIKKTQVQIHRKGGDDMGENKKEEQVVKAVDETVLQESLDTLSKAVEGIANLFTVEKAEPGDDPDPEKKESVATDLEKKGAAISAGNKKKIEDVIKILQALVSSVGGDAPSVDDKTKTKKGEDSEPELSKAEIDAAKELADSLVSEEELKDMLKGAEEKVTEALK